MKKQILVCDDQVNVRESYKLIFEKEYDLVFAENGQYALLWLKEGNRPDLVVMDIKMPRMDGLTTLKELKKIQPELPVLIVTGYDCVDTATAALQAGAFDYLVKPFDPEQIKKIVTMTVPPTGSQ